MRILVRVDADATIGLGHAMRALAAAEALSSATGAETCVLARPSGLIEEAVAQMGASLLPVRAQGYAVSEIAGIVEGGDVLVSDTYELDVDALETLDVPHLVIDDFATLESYACDVLVNPNLGADPGAYRGPGTVLAGPEYALLRREVREAAERSRTRERGAERILVCLGGGRWPAAAEELLVRATTLGGVVRATAPTNVVGVESVPAASLPDQLAWADVAVISGGVVKYEAAACGLPSVVVAVVPHQEAVARAFADTGAAVYGGTLGEASAGAISQGLERLLADASLRRRQAAAGRALVDGEGASRVASAFLDAIVASRS